VIAVRVHPEWLERQRLSPGRRGRSFWEQRYQSINAFEEHLDRNGTKVVKLFLHVSKREQRRRLLARLDDPHKQWKFSASDLAERAHWSRYMRAYEAAITATSTPWAPWYVVPADNKPLMRALVGEIVVEAISSMGLTWPRISDEELAAQAEARRKLLGQRA
jgi:polyphosphate kinase 2 (PPK2 family)